MLRFALALTAASLVAGTNAASADDQVFQGDVFFIATSIDSSACSDAGVHRYDYLRMTLRPATSINGPHTQMNIFGPRVAYHFTINHAFSGSGNYSAIGFGSKGNSFHWAATFSAATTTPDMITNTTHAITVKVNLKNFLNIAGCTATIAGTLGLRPDI